MAEAAKAKSKPKTMDEQVYPVIGQEVADMTYGPYADYRVIDTPVGQFAVPAHHVMTIERRPVWDAKLGENVMRSFPQYEAVPTNDPRMKPHGELSAEELEAIAEHRKARADGRIY